MSVQAAFTKGNSTVELVLEAGLHDSQMVNVSVDSGSDSSKEEEKTLSKRDKNQEMGDSFLKRYQKTGDLKDLEAALQAFNDTMKLTPIGHPGRGGCLQSIALSLRERPGDLKDLEAALKMDQEAVDLTPAGLEKAEYLQSLAGSFRERYHRLGQLKDLETTLQLKQEAVALTPGEHPDRSRRLHGLGVSLRDRYLRLGDLKDLETAPQIKKDALDLTPTDHSDRAGRLAALAVSFLDQYQRLGHLKDLEATLQLKQEAVDLTPEGHPDKPMRLQSLAVSVRERYQRTGDLQDLEIMLQIKQRAVLLTPAEHPGRAWRLVGLAVAFADRYQHLGDLKDLEAALQTNQEAVNLIPKNHFDRAGGHLKDLHAALQNSWKAVELTPVGHPDRAANLQKLAFPITDRYKKLGDLKDLETALQINQEAVDLTLKEHPDKPVYLQNLALAFRDQYLRLRDLADLETTSKLLQEAETLTLEEDPARGRLLQLLALSFLHRYLRLKKPEDLEAVGSHFRASFKTPTTSTPEISWGSVLTWATFSEKFKPSDCPTAYSTAFGLLPDILWIGQSIPRLDMEHITSTATRTCIHLSDLTAAVEIIEQGLSTTFQQTLQLRTGLDELNPDEAQKLQHLSSKLIREHLLTWQILQSKEGNSCIKFASGQVSKIFSSPSHTVLCVMHHKKAKLKDWISHCNVRIRGESDSTRLFGHREQFKSKTSEEFFTDMLTWLWTHVVGPVYKVLKSHNIIKATLGSLLEANARRTSRIAHKLGVVGVTHTGPDKRNALKGVKQEVAKIVSIIGESHVQCLEGQQATVDAVKQQLQDCSWVHMACHGKQDLVDPTKSHLLLYGGILELETILRMPLPHAEFVFLAACQTAMGDSRLVNESFHLGGGFIAAGFRGAIGTMWSMNDDDGPLVAEIMASTLRQVIQLRHYS
ncbi:CHAT domain-containing protein [Mycena vulgaris]|nr:CHAT domain-containing protein [Mycena vulgaris]